MASDPPVVVPTEAPKHEETAAHQSTTAPAANESAKTEPVQADVASVPATSSKPIPETQAAAAVVVAAAAVAAIAEAEAAPSTLPSSTTPATTADAPTTVAETTHAAPEAALSEAASTLAEPAPVPAPTSSSSQAHSEATAAAVEDAPDPDEDDLDDLDDVLDQFTATKISSASAAPLPSTVNRATVESSSPFNLPFPSALPPQGAASAVRDTGDTTEAGLLPDDEEFAAQLQAGMADLMKELEGNPEMSKQFEEMMRELGDSTALAGVGAEAALEADAASTAGDASAASTAGAVPADSFQENIRRTMERMQASSDTASAAAASSSAVPDDFMATLLKEMEGSGLGSDEDFSKMLMGMMEQLTNKDVLYEPMKELDDKFPAWLAENGSKIDKKEKERYELQQSLVREIVAKFEEPGYADEKIAYRDYIVERMQKMQSAGSPPPDLVGDMNAAQDALGDMDAGCPTQ